MYWVQMYVCLVNFLVSNAWETIMYVVCLNKHMLWIEHIALITKKLILYVTYVLTNTMLELHLKKVNWCNNGKWEFKREANLFSSDTFVNFLFVRSSRRDHSSRLLRSRCVDQY